MSVSVAARAISGFDARWMTTPCPSMARRSAPRSLTSPRTTPKRGSDRWWAWCHSRPDEKLSKMVTLRVVASDRSRSTKWPPMNPAPPTTKTLSPMPWLTLANRLPLGGLHLQRRVRHQQVPEDRAQAFGVWGDALRIQRRDDDARVCGLAGEAAVPADDPVDARSHLLPVLER